MLQRIRDLHRTSSPGPSTTKTNLHSRTLTPLSVWLPVAIGLTVIAMESTRFMGADHTSPFLHRIYQFFFGSISDGDWGSVHHLLRKSGHFIGYGTLGITWLRAWLLTFTSRYAWTLAEWRIRSTSLGVFCTFLTASVDEYHQHFLANRTGQFSDVLLDTAGALVFTLLAVMRWHRHRHLHRAAVQ